MGIFQIERYPVSSTTGGVAWSKTDIDNMWIDFSPNNVASLMFGDFNMFRSSNFCRIHSKAVVDIEIKEHHGNIYNRNFEGNYNLYQKDNAFWLRITIKFKRIMMDRIEYTGPFIRNADYRFYQEILKRRKI